MKTNVSQYVRPLIDVADATFAAMREELVLACIPWEASYREYQSGGWFTAPLMNRSGLNSERVISDGSGRSTELMVQFRTTKGYLDSLGLSIMCVRLAKMQPGACLFEHVDYEELLKVPRFRLHIPLITNPAARLILGQESVHLSAGRVWVLDPKIGHASINGGLHDRVHLLIDCYCNPVLEDLLSQQADQFEVVPKPKLSVSAKKKILRTSTALLVSNQLELAEIHVLKTYHSYSLSPGSSYDLLIELYAQQSEPHLMERKSFWLARKSLYLGGIHG